MALEVPIQILVLHHFGHLVRHTAAEKHVNIMNPEAGRDWDAPHPQRTKDYLSKVPPPHSRTTMGFKPLSSGLLGTFNTYIVTPRHLLTCRLLFI